MDGWRSRHNGLLSAHVSGVKVSGVTAARWKGNRSQPREEGQNASCPARHAQHFWSVGVHPRLGGCRRAARAGASLSRPRKERYLNRGSNSAFVHSLDGKIRACIKHRGSVWYLFLFLFVSFCCVLHEQCLVRPSSPSSAARILVRCCGGGRERERGQGSKTGGRRNMREARQRKRRREEKERER